MKFLFVLLSSMFLIGMVSAALELKTNQYVSLQTDEQYLWTIKFPNESGKNIIYKDLPINSSFLSISGVTGAYEYPPESNPYDPTNMTYHSFYLNDVVAKINILAAMPNKTSAVKMYFVLDKNYKYNTIWEREDGFYQFAFKGEMFVESLVEGRLVKRSYNQTITAIYNKPNKAINYWGYPGTSIAYGFTPGTGVFKVYDANVCPVLEAHKITKVNRTLLLRER